MNKIIWFLFLLSSVHTWHADKGSIGVAQRLGVLEALVATNTFQIGLLSNKIDEQIVAMNNRLQRMEDVLRTSKYVTPYTLGVFKNHVLRELEIIKRILQGDTQSIDRLLYRASDFGYYGD